MDIVRVKKSQPLVLRPGQKHTPPPRPISDFKRVVSSVLQKIKPVSSGVRNKLLIILIMSIFTCSLFGYWYWKNTVLLSTQTDNELGFFQLIGQVFTGGNSVTIKGEKRGRTNFYLMGIADEKHDGSTLSDSNILVSINHETKEVAIVHLPRDMEVQVDGLGYRKLNSVHATGEAIKKDSGPQYATDALAQNLALPIDYYLRINFSGVVDFIDALGGVEVNVENAFTDYKYPDNNNGYITISFSAGKQLMDGEKLLQYVRSRHSGDNNEGSDFARGRRQTLAIEAIKNKVASLSLLTDSDMMLKLFGIITHAARTNMKSSEALRLYNIVSDIPNDHIFSTALDNSAYGFLMDFTNLDGAYSLIPTDGSYTKIQEYLRNIFNLNSLQKERATIVVRNGNGIPGEAGFIANKLLRKNLLVLRSENADNFNYKNSVIYDFSEGKKPATQAALRELLKNVKVETEAPEFIKNSGDSMSDFVILLGNDLSYQD